MAEKVRQYVAIDAKSFYASVECVERHLNPLTTNLVVADESRTEKTICLAVSPSLKAHGIPGRARLFEVIQRMKQVNRERLNAGIRSGAIRRDPETRKYQFSASSFDAEALEKDPTLEISYIVAPPRMRLYEEYSSRIYATYLKYVSSEDIIVYSIDEVFIDVTDYLRTYGMTAHELTMTMVRDVLYNTGITATAGIGTNLFLAKIAMDIEAKKSKPDKDGVRIAALDEMTFREKLWTHRPLTDFWRIGKGISQKLEFVPVYLFRCEAAGITEVLVHMAVYLISCCNLCLQFFPFQFFISELWLIDRVEPKPGHLATFVVWVFTHFHVVESVWAALIKRSLCWFQNSFLKMIYSVFSVLVLVFVRRYAKTVFQVFKGYIQRVHLPTH